MYFNVWRLDIRACFVEKIMNLTGPLYVVTYISSTYGGKSRIPLRSALYGHILVAKNG